MTLQNAERGSRAYAARAATTAAAHPADAGAPAGTATDRAEFWSKSLRRWDIAFYLMALIGGAALLVDGNTPRDTALAVGALVVMVGAYTFVGRRAARTGDARLAMAYLALLLASTVVVVRFDPTGTVLLFIAYSQIWFFSSSRRAGAIACGVLSVGLVAAIWLHEGLRSDLLPQIATQAALGLAFAILLGLWITQVAEQSEERAQLLIRLEAAQAELAASHHSAGVDAERQRMAQEIHDTLAQGFTSIIMLTQTASTDLRRGQSERAAERLDLVERTARDNLAEARALVAAFAPVGLDGAGLGEALQRLAVRFEQETGVRVDVTLPDETTARSIGREREVILLRAAQEALSNVRRHARAGHVGLVLSGDTDSPGPAGDIQLEVVDDGRGIDGGAAEGFGLRGMRDRVTTGGGRLEVSGGDNGGTRVRVTLPQVRREEGQS
ncbi:MAG TPA: sensor histidine kinase [Actinotalea sp.]|jgi:signal transduction histidine kinase